MAVGLELDTGTVLVLILITPLHYLHLQGQGGTPPSVLLFFCFHFQTVARQKRTEEKMPGILSQIKNIKLIWPKLQIFIFENSFFFILGENKVILKFETHNILNYT